MLAKTLWSVRYSCATQKFKQAILFLQFPGFLSVHFYCEKSANLIANERKSKKMMKCFCQHQTIKRLNCLYTLRDRSSLGNLRLN